jgi:uncharacterized protein YbjT (DUF2867 family)
MNKINAAVAGASGLVGGFILRRLLDDPNVIRVVAPTRKPLTSHPKLYNPRFQDGAFPVLSTIDEAYCALGTTRAQAGSDEAFRAVDLELCRDFARAAKTAGARRFALISSVGANPRSRFLYPRVKAEAEAAASSFGFESVVMARPSFLLGNRKDERPTEKLAHAILRIVTPFLIGRLRRYRGVEADAVAANSIGALRGRVPGVLVLESEHLGAI